MIYRRLTAALTAAVCCAGLWSCGAKTGTESSSMVILEDGAGELVQPAEDDPEYALGAYRCSPSGVKLYFNEEEYPASLLLYLEKLFGTYPARDYDTYLTCIHPTYIESMEEYLPKEFDYDLKTSFTNRCDSLDEQMGGSYSLTRVKADVPEEDFSDDFFEQISHICGEDYGKKIKEDSDNVYCIQLYVMVTGSAEGEQLFFKNTENGMGIVVVEKDGQYYAFC